MVDVWRSCSELECTDILFAEMSGESPGEKYILVQQQFTDDAHSIPLLKFESSNYSAPKISILQVVLLLEPIIDFDSKLTLNIIRSVDSMSGDDPDVIKIMLPK